ncbi:FeoB-associated Cys-rich membrane protein [Aestuariicella hydrocarbonica]|uniref:FeoB-associated Cys-rich membrane protein n=1 Tax=Pseudomaricurvus hydrocarbonicus TaxID=1470433 RepID=A0A9E5JZG7_9GAMM|nr:FeoB-associated Cys-rich membrane protein [Aestuariicella hydrocarbonica]NHO65432.1 FeoB-associated Cys-rich membrane protein [Aestuariicella hydrocarbonica]
MWQEVIVGICVTLAVIVVVRRMLPGKAGGCGSGCGGCSSQSACTSSQSPPEIAKLDEQRDVPCVIRIQPGSSA